MSTKPTILLVDDREENLLALGAGPLRELLRALAPADASLAVRTSDNRKRDA